MESFFGDPEPEKLYKGTMRRTLEQARMDAAYNYCNAVNAFYEAYVELAGIDAAISVNSGECISSFGYPLEDLRVHIHAHPLAPGMDHGSFPEKIAEARKRHLWHNSLAAKLKAEGWTFGQPSTPGGSN